jgi:regulator of protease activity HflC (stomatin/prohibitin superfamily)
MKAEAKKECDKAKMAAEQKAEEILAEAKKQHSNLVARYKSDYLKWQHLQAEIKLLEERKKEISER